MVCKWMLVLIPLKGHAQRGVEDGLLDYPGCREFEHLQRVGLVAIVDQLLPSQWLDKLVQLECYRRLSITKVAP